MTSLYAMTEQMRELASMLDSDDEGLVQAIQDTMQGVKGEITSKAEAIVMLSRNMSGDIAALDVELDRLGELKRVRENGLKKLMDYLKRNLEAAKARYDNLRRGYLAGKQRVTSPIGGYVTSVNARSGGFVETGQVVMTISKGGSMYLKAELQPKYFSALGGLSSVNVRMPSGEVLSLEDLGGSMLSYGKSIGADSPLIPVTFQIRRIGDILPGTFMEIFLVCESGRAGLSVPVESIVEEMGNYFVFVQLTPELFEKREVSLGASDCIRREILSGLSEGERVVGKGAVLVKLSQAAGKLDAHSGHVH